MSNNKIAGGKNNSDKEDINDNIDKAGKQTENDSRQIKKINNNKVIVSETTQTTKNTNVIKISIFVIKIVTKIITMTKNVRNLYRTMQTSSRTF